ncbi:MAG: VapC toxin family PIN domain ribonuclease [Pseudonocardiales bacterium]|nr:type II toxin-antitoxin system VapC family toxin [Pseudonocardiales bacterium]PZS25246.1 MAG: VapC toxin family PIN domain ribonuclease [Pseudonocardiales bacterium]
MIYLDTSAFVKLVWAEPESDALSRFLTERSATPLVSSVLLTVETRRAVQREDPSALARADLLLTRIGRIGMTASVVESASRLPDRSLRSLDAIHLATALMLRDDLDVIVTYDRRLAAAAEAHNLPVDLPGVAANG